jgi:hypothetical protein
LEKNLTIEPKLPKHISLSPHLRERAAFYIVIMLQGSRFYIAATPEVRRMLRVDIHGKPAMPKRRRKDEFDTEKALRDVLASVLLQLRDCVFAEIEGNVKQTLLHRMSQLMSPTVRGMIETSAANRFLLEDHLNG